MRIKLTLDMIPPSPNKQTGLTWAARAYNKRARRPSEAPLGGLSQKETWVTLLESKLRHLGSYTRKQPEDRRRVTIVQYRQRLMDADNAAASCKRLLDAMQAVCLIRNDNHRWCDFKSYQVQSQNEKTEIIIESMEE